MLNKNRNMKRYLKPLSNYLPLALAAVGARTIAIILKFPGFPPGWGGEMASVANSIAMGHGFASPYIVPTGSTALIPPVYPYLLSIFFKIFGQQSETAGFAALGLNVILSALVLVPLFVLTKRLFDRRAALIAVWLWALLPLSGYTDALYIWNTSLFTLALTTLIAFTLSLDKENIRSSHLVVYALFAGFTILLEPASLIVVAVSWLWLAYQRFPAKNLIQVLMIASILPCAWMVRNFIVFHQFVFIRSGLGLELSRGIRDYELVADKPASLPNRNSVELKKYQQMGELVYMQSRLDDGLQWIEENPIEYGERVVSRVVAYWTGYRVSRIYLFYGEFELIKRVFFSLPILGIFLSLFALKKRDILLVHFILLLYPVMYCLTHVELRYRLPLEPLLYSITIGAIAVLYEQFRWRNADPFQTQPSLARRFAEPITEYD